MEQETSSTAGRIPVPGPWPGGCIEFIGSGEEPGCSVTSTALAVALARSGSRVAYLLNAAGSLHAEGLRDLRSEGPWRHITPDVPVAPGELRVAQQAIWIAGGPRAAFARRNREMTELPGQDRTGWLSPEAVETWERPLPGEHELTPDQRRRYYQVRAARAEARRMLAVGEAGDIVIIDSGKCSRVVGVPVDYTLVVRKWDPADMKDLEKPGFPRLTSRQAARCLAERMGEPPAGPWALVISRAPRDERDHAFYDAVCDELRNLGMTELSDVTFVPYHEDLNLGGWRRQTRGIVPDGPAHAFRPGGFVTNSLDELQSTVIRALITPSGA